MKTLLILLGVVATASAKSPKQAHVNVPEHYTQVAPGADSSTPPASEWWKEFHDPVLDNLVARALDRNRDIHIAAARIAEARGAEGVSKSALLPQAGLTNNFNRIRGGYAQGVVRADGRNLVSAFDTNSFQAGFDARWELDFFGGNRKAREAATADVAGAIHSREGVKLSVSAEVARLYVAIRGLERRMEITRRNVGTQRETLDLTRARAEAGLATQLDVERQNAQLATTQSVVPALESERLQAIERLSVIVDQPSAELVAVLRNGAGLPLNPPVIGLGLPSSLLERRPDIRRAEADIAAAGYRWGAARAEYFPKFVITGISGRQSTDLGGFTLGAGNFFSVGPGITMPIFSAGRIRANVAAKDARLDQAIAEYENTVLNAVSEVQSAVIAWGHEEERRGKLEAAVQSSKTAVDLANELYARGLSDFLTVLEAQRAQLAAEDALAQSETSTITNAVALFKAIGGGL